MSFKISEIREILGEAFTDDVAKKLVSLHRTVVDPLLDQLDDAKRDATKYKTEADKVPGLEQKVKDLEGGEDWKGKYEKEKADHQAYRDQVAQEASTAKVEAAYKKLLTDEKISDKALALIIAAKKADFGKMKLKEDGTLDGVEDLKKEINDNYAGFRVQQRQRGEKVETPPAGAPSGSDNAVRDLTAKWHAQRYGEAPKTT